MAITAEEIELIRKEAASRHVLAHAKSRTGRRPMSVATLLQKEKEGTFFKGAYYVGNRAHYGSKLWDGFARDIERAEEKGREVNAQKAKDKSIVKKAMGFVGTVIGMGPAAEAAAQTYRENKARRPPDGQGWIIGAEREHGKHASYGDTEPLWMDPDMGKIDYESKVPVKLNQRITAPDGKKGDAPSDNMLGGIKSEDGRGNATTVAAGANTGGDVVPDAMPSNYKLSAACIDELHKLGAVTDEEAMETLNRLDSLDKNKLTADQVGRYATLGAIAGPAINFGKSMLQGKGIGGYFGKDHTTLLRRARHIGGDAIAGAATSGAIPLLRSALDRRASEQKLQDYVHTRAAGTPPHVMPPPPGDDAAPMVDPPVKTAGIGNFVHSVRSLNTAPAHSAHWEHATDLLGLGAMATASGSHLAGQLSQRKDPNAPESGPISTAGQASLDLGGLATMTIPTIAALNQLRKGHVPTTAPGANTHAGGGRWGTNLANFAGLGALAIPTADKLQAHFRASPGESEESKMLLGHKAHRALELGGYGALAAGALRNADNDWKDKAMQLAGYGALTAPHISEAVGGPSLEGPGRTALELGGLAALSVPSIRSMASHH